MRRLETQVQTTHMGHSGAESGFLWHPGIQDGRNIWQKSRKIKKMLDFLSNKYGLVEDISEMNRKTCSQPNLLIPSFNLKPLRGLPNFS